jgi:hypothetical protein
MDIMMELLVWMLVCYGVLGLWYYFYYRHYWELNIRNPMYKGLHLESIIKEVEEIENMVKELKKTELKE